MRARTLSLALSFSIAMLQLLWSTNAANAHHPTYCGHGSSPIYYGSLESQDIYVTFQNIDGSHLHQYNHYTFFYNSNGERIGQYAHSFWRTC